MQRRYPIRSRRGLRGLGYPIIPDQFTTAAGVPEAFSLKTPDATIMQILQQQGQQLPAALAAAMAAGAPSTTYVAPNQSPITGSVSLAPDQGGWHHVLRGRKSESGELFAARGDSFRRGDPFASYD